MGMKQTLDVINRMEADCIIDRYAIAGPVATYNYIEPAVTSDLDILVSFDKPASSEKPSVISLDSLLFLSENEGIRPA